MLNIRFVINLVCQNFKLPLFSRFVVSVAKDPLCDNVSIDAPKCRQEPLGAEVIVDVKVGENFLKVRRRCHLQSAVGTRSLVIINKDKIQIFHKDNGIAIT